MKKKIVMELCQKSNEKSSSSGMELIIRLITMAGHCSIFATQDIKLKRLTILCQRSNKTISKDMGICSCRYFVLIFEQIGQVVVDVVVVVVVVLLVVVVVVIGFLP